MKRSEDIQDLLDIILIGSIAAMAVGVFFILTALAICALKTL